MTRARERCIVTAMVAEEEVRTFVAELAREFSPRRVVLFGSRGRGDFSGDSDVDLLVVMQTEKSELQQALDIRLRIPCSFPLDLVVKTPREVDRRLALQDSFLTAVLAEGQTLYESPGP